MKLDGKSSHFVSDTKTSRRWLFLGAALMLVAPAAVSAKSAMQSRYPYDPACAWGRIANGRGMLHRCISRKEAEGLAKKNGISSPESTKKKSPPHSHALPEALPRNYSLSVGPISAENGTITVGRLSLPTDRYRDCVDKNGGLTETNAQVVVKFLVRGEKGRAEGVSVQSRRGISKKAANCLAEVVDRRKVGPPSEPMTAARLTFQFTEKK